MPANIHEVETHAPVIEQEDVEHVAAQSVARFEHPGEADTRHIRNGLWKQRFLNSFSHFHIAPHPAASYRVERQGMHAALKRFEEERERCTIVTQETPTITRVPLSVDQQPDWKSLN